MVVIKVKLLDDGRFTAPNLNLKMQMAAKIRKIVFCDL